MSNSSAGDGVELALGPCETKHFELEADAVGKDERPDVNCLP